MSEWAPKRFWTSAAAGRGTAGFAVLLDGRTARTPARHRLEVPNLALAEAIAEEWAAQGEAVDPASMPLTRLANAALDRVAPQREEVVRIVAAYGESDLLCYRAESPAALVARQQAGWDPLLDWAAEALDAPLTRASGVMHVPQPAESLARLAGRVAALDAFRLTGLHELTALSGSLVLALAVLTRRLDAATAWPLSRIDETWQAEQWGEDAEAAAGAAAREADFLLAERFLQLLETEHV
ncbi:MAG: ATPase [Alphaproteobacteria bacterium]|nr:MAG: ATPase [Alphaproteobacteria bacterium]